MRLPRAARTVLLAALALGVAAPLGPAHAAPDQPPGPRDLITTDLDTPSTDVGRWSVAPADDGGWQVTWTAPEDLPVLDSRPRVVLAEPVGDTPAGTSLGDATVERDDRTVSLRLPGGTAPDPDALDLRLGARTLDEPVADAVTSPDADGPAPAPTTGPDPGGLGRHPVVVSDYTRPGIKLPGLPDPVEMVGHVEAPADATGRSPLVVLLHGRHTTCRSRAGADLTWPCPADDDAVPRHLGLHYLQRRLASQGFVTVSVSANGISAQDGALADGGALARARLVRAHLDVWADWVAAGTQHADLGHVVLLGHGRGGEGAAVAALETPLSAAYRIRGLVLLAPTDLAGRATPYVPSVTLLPSCDGDVVDLQGQAWTDAAPGLAAHDTALHSSVLLVGANHRWFNSEWTGDDWPGTSGPCARDAAERLDAHAQRVATRTYVTGAVRLLARQDATLLPLYDGSPVSAPSTGDAVVRSHAVGAGRALRRPGADAVPTPTTGGATSQLCRSGALAEPEATCGRDVGHPWLQLPHWPAPSTGPARPALELDWSAPGATGGLRLRAPWDVSAAPALDLRAAVDPAQGPVRLDVRLTDAAGRSTTVTPADEGRLSPLPSGGESPGRLWAQALRVPLGSAPIDLRHLVRVDLVARSERGRVWVLDLSAVRPGLPAVPARRVPLLDLGSVSLREGDSGTVARVPYRLRGPLTRDALVRLTGLGAPDRSTIRVRVPAGTTSGTVAWPVPPSRRDSLARSVTELTAYGLSGVVAGDASGSVTVLDDDPPPRVRVRSVRDRVSEGGTLTWVVSWSPRSDYAPYVRRRVLPARVGRSASSVDLPPGFAAYAEHALSDPTTRRWVVRVPVRRDGRPEPREVVRVRVALPQFGWRGSLRGTVRASR